ncbi:MAG: hypothetical protein K1X67_12475 [Fimbriimonadaceae bacterium]|nr:hypothetical protein [Fimbriimonadaceae bacterium]
MSTQPTRRDVLAGAFTTAAALALGPMARAIQHKDLVIGKDPFAFKVTHDWLVPPSSINYGDTHGLAVDQHGHIYLAHTVHSSSVGSDAVLVFDQKGKFMNSWGADFRGGAHGLDIRKEGSEEFLYHCDTRRRLIVKTDLKGKIIWSQGMPKDSGVYTDANQWCPTNVAFDPNGDVIVGDGYGSHYIHRYSKDGVYKGILIKPGSEAGFVREPHGLWVDHRGKEPLLIVADRGNRRLQSFTLDGKHVGFVTEGIRRPCHVHFNHDHMLVPDLESIVTILDKNDKVVAALGDGHPSNLRGAPRDQWLPGKFIHPHAAIWVNKNDIVVAEWVPTGRVTRLQRV